MRSWWKMPGRPAIRQLLAARGARLFDIPVGRSGSELEGVFDRADDARLACVAPTVQFPTCTSMAEPARARLLDWARGSESWIIEDDRDSDIWFDDAPPPRPLAADDGERVLLIGSFNRILFPGLCVAFLVVPNGLVERLRAVHAMIGGRASLASQLALREFIGEGHFARHLRRRRQAYAERRAMLLECLEAHGAITAANHVGNAGLHLVLDLGHGRAREAAVRLGAARLGGVALDLFGGDRAGAQLLLGLGAGPDVIRTEGPRVAAAILHDNSDPRGER